jgi:hypothetical protein
MTTSQFRDAAVGYLSSRLVDSHGPEAATLQLRPSLQKVHDDLVAVLDNAVQLKQNASLLVIGEPGIGKTMVRGSKVLKLNRRSCKPTARAQPHVAAWLQCTEQHLVQQFVGMLGSFGMCGVCMVWAHAGLIRNTTRALSASQQLQLVAQHSRSCCVHNTPDTAEKIERIISLLSASPVGEARLPMPKGMAYKD